jgi:hypothetical protein
VGEKEKRERKIKKNNKKKPAAYVAGWKKEKRERGKKKACCWVGERKERGKKKSNGNVSCLKRYQWSIKIKNKKFQ